MNQQFVIIGLRRLGISMVGTLDPLAHEVRAIDKRESVIQSLANEAAVLGPEVEGFDAAPVMIGKNHIGSASSQAMDRSPLVQPDGP
jgi:Trk K+ transport system NAD-binding subunit